MNNRENIYTDWKSSRSRIDLPEGFSDRVMTQIEKQEQSMAERHKVKKISPFLEKIIEIVVGFGLSFLGALRVAHMAGGLLLP